MNIIKLALLISLSVNIYPAIVGLPLNEDFSQSSLKDTTNTTASWSTEEKELILSWKKSQYIENSLANNPTKKDITSDTDSTNTLKLGDLDGDGDLDVVVGNNGGMNKFYLNNGTLDPFNGVNAKNISSDLDNTRAISLGDINGDGNLDLIVGNYAGINRLYINNATADPFNGVLAKNISIDSDNTYAVNLGDFDNDGDLDLVVGNNGINKLYLNNGSVDPFNGVLAKNISIDSDVTLSIGLGDLDNDGDLDLVVGNNGGVNKAYLNNATLDPFNGVLAQNISSDSDLTNALELRDLDGDKDLDLLVVNNGVNKLYFNNGTVDPFSGVVVQNISSDSDNTLAVSLEDIDNDGDLDVICGNYAEVNKLYLNNGTLNPFHAVNAKNILSDSDNTFSIEVGDLDGDGDLDLVVGNSGETNKLYLNNTSLESLELVSAKNISNDSFTTYDMVFGDLDNDGDMDLVMGNDGGINKLYLNNGTVDPFNGVLAKNISNDSDNTLSLKIGDVDSDGDLDVVVGNYNQTNKLYLNNGTTDPFSGVSATNISNSLDATFVVDLEDFDGDGDLDVIVGNSGINKLYLNNATSDPFNGVVAKDISADSDDTYIFSIGDLDKDGDLDIAMGNNGVNKLYLNNGSLDPFNGVISKSISNDSGSTFGMDAGDIDGDGDLDLVVGNYGGLKQMYLNNGTVDPFNGVLAKNVTDITSYTYSVKLGDLDEDGDLDLVVGNNGVNEFYVNNGTTDPFNGVIVKNIFNDLDNTYVINLGDFDGDGFLDIVTANNGVNKLYINNKTSTPFNSVSTRDISTDETLSSQVVLGDLDGDGDLDAVVGNNLGRNNFYLNNGTSEPFKGVLASEISNDTDNTYSVALGDMNGDGDLDLVTGTYAGINKLYLNNGTSNPFNGVSSLNISNDADKTQSIVLNDLNGDGKLDILVANFSQKNKLYLNNGTNDPFNGVLASNISNDTDDTIAISSMDLNGDSKLDVVVGNYYQKNKFYLNNGTSNSFNGVSSNDISSDEDDTRSIAFADLDQDGDLDLVIGNYNQKNKLYTNNGTATPFNGVLASDISSDEDATRSLAFADLDQDGDLDLVVGNEREKNKLYRNNATANPFSGVIGKDISTDTDQTYSVCIADLNKDGNLDLVVGNYGEANKLYVRQNFKAHLNKVSSININATTDNIEKIKITPTEVIPNNTSIDYYVSNNGGIKYFKVRKNNELTFATTGNDLRWKVELNSLSPSLSPRLKNLAISVPNSAPNASSFSIDIDEDEVRVFTSTQVSAINFQDVNNDSLDAIFIKTLPDKGVLTLNDLNITLNQKILGGDIIKIKFVPYLNEYATPYTHFNYVVSDAEANSSVETITFNVAAVDDAPLITTIANQISQEDANDFNITFNASDEEGDPISYTVRSSNPSIATVSVVGNKLLINQVQNKYGTITIDLNASANGLSSVKSFELNIQSVNDAPSIDTVFENLTINEDSPSFKIDMNVSDLEGDDLNITLESNNTNIINLTPNWENLLEHSQYTAESVDFNITTIDNAYGTVKISVFIDDGEQTRTKDFTLIVNPIVDPLSIGNAPSDQIVYKNFNDKNISFSIINVDNEPLKYNLLYDEDLLKVSVFGTNIISLTCLEGESGSSDVNLSVHGASSSSRLSFKIRVLSFDEGTNILEKGKVEQTDINGTKTLKISFSKDNLSVKKRQDSLGMVSHEVKVDSKTTKASSSLSGAVGDIVSNGVRIKYIPDQNRSVEVTATVLGHAIHKMNLQGDLSEAKFELVGASSVIDNDEDGNLEVISTLAREDTNVSIVSKADGTTQQIIKNASKQSKVISKFKETKIVVRENGNIETTIGKKDNGDGYDLKAVLITNAQGGTTTRFVKVSQTDENNITSISNTLNESSSFALGTEIEVSEIENIFYIKSIVVLEQPIVID